MKLPSKEKCAELAAPGRPHYVPDDYLMFVIHRAYKEGAEARSREILRTCERIQEDALSVDFDNGIEKVKRAIRNLKVEE